MQIMFISDGTIFIQFNIIFVVVIFVIVLFSYAKWLLRKWANEIEWLLHILKSPIGKNYAFKSKLLITLMLTQPICLLNRFNLIIQSESFQCSILSHCMMIAYAIQTLSLLCSISSFWLRCALNNTHTLVYIRIVYGGMAWNWGLSDNNHFD